LTGKEILLFDPRRNPRDWVEVLGPTQCAVLLKDRLSSKRTADGSAAKAEGKDPRLRLTPQVRTYLRSNT
jgi:hypothetical protein